MPADVSELLELSKYLRSSGRKVRRQVGVAVRQTTEQVKNDAFNAAPELTGELRESITATTRGLRGNVQATARYAEYVEFGTGHGPPQPFMNPAADKADGAFPSDVEQAVIDALGI